MGKILLNDLVRTRLSRGLKIYFLTPSTVSKLSLFLILSVCLLCSEGVEEEPNRDKSWYFIIFFFNSLGWGQFLRKLIKLICVVLILVLLHNGGSCNACTIKRSITLLWFHKQSK